MGLIRSGGIPHEICEAGMKLEIVLAELFVIVDG